MTAEKNIAFKRKQTLLLVEIIVFSLCACKDYKKREDAAKVVVEWLGKEIKFPDYVPCFVLGKDTLPELCEDCFHKEYKILLYINSAGCSVCKLDLYEWEKIIKEADSLFPNKVGFLLFLQPNNMEELTNFLLYNKFNYPVFMDTIGSINRLNQFPQVMQHQCYLLDKDNKVLAIGNPASNIQIWDLYKKIISNEKKTDPKIFTAIKIDKTAHNYEINRKGILNISNFILMKKDTIE
jgi:hypothetical protein